MSEHGEFQVQQEEWLADDGRRGWSAWTPTEGRFMVRWEGYPQAAVNQVVFVDSPYAARDMLIDLGFSYVGQRPRVSQWCGPDGFSARFTADTRVAWFTVERG